MSAACDTSTCKVLSGYSCSTTLKKCVKCNANCVCSLDNLCVSCVSGFSLLNNQCQNFCPAGTVMINGACTASCPQGTFMNDNTCVTDCPSDKFADLVDFKCRAACPDSETASKGVNRYSQLKQGTDIKLCFDKCLYEFYIQGYFCVSACDSGLYSSDSDPKSCYSECPQTTYIMGMKCVQSCPPGYFTVGRSCLDKCPSNYYTDKINWQCVLTCPSTLYKLESTKECLSACPTTLFTQKTQMACITSCVGFYITDNLKECYSSCPSSFYTYEPLKACYSSCPSSLFTHESSKICMKNCDGLFYNNRNCVHNCPKYAHPDMRKCSETCDTGYYTSISTKECIKGCYQNQYLIESTKSCVSNCPGQYKTMDGSNRCFETCESPLLEDIQNKKCIRNCPKNSFLYNGKCYTTCPASTYKVISSMICSTSCPKGSFLVPDQNLCVESCPKDNFISLDGLKCVSKCNTGELTDFTQMKCLTVCPSNVFLDIDTKSCLQNCTTGKFQDSELKTCSSSCSNNKFILGNLCVNTCPENYVTNTNFCVLSTNCPANYFPIAGACKLCPVLNCSVCLDSQTCKQCSNNNYMIENTKLCTSNVLDGYFKDINQMLLKACPPGCSKCLNPGNCMECQNGHFLSKNDCIKCQVDSCDACDGPLNCTKCTSPMLNYNGKCYQTCPDGTFFNSNKCSVCSQKYSHCQLCNSSSCLKCEPNYMLKEDYAKIYNYTPPTNISCAIFLNVTFQIDKSMKVQTTLNTQNPLVNKSAVQSLFVVKTINNSSSLNQPAKPPTFTKSTISTNFSSPPNTKSTTSSANVSKPLSVNKTQGNQQASQVQTQIQTSSSPNSQQVSVEVNDPSESEYFYPVDVYQGTSILEASQPDSGAYNQNTLDLSEKVSKAGSVLAKASAIITAGFFGWIQSFSFLWFLIDAIQLSYFLLFIGGNFPINVSDFLKSLKAATFSVLPLSLDSKSDGFIQVEDQNSPELFMNFDISSSFIKNAGFVVALFFLAFLLLLTAKWFNSRYYYRNNKNFWSSFSWETRIFFEFNAFMKLLQATFMIVCFAACLQFTNVNFKNAINILSFVLCLITPSLCLAFIILLIHVCYNFEEGYNENFKRRFKDISEVFKDNNLLVRIYFPMQLFKKLAVAMIIVFLRDFPNAQLVLLLSLYLLNAAYTSLTKPFKKKNFNILMILTDLLLIFSIIILIVIFNFDFDEDDKIKIGWIFISLIFSTIVVWLGMFFMELFNFIYTFFKNRQKNRTLQGKIFEMEEN